MNFKFNKFPNLKTERLFLRELFFDDIQVVFELRSNKKVNALISRKIPNNLDEAREFISVCHEEFKNENRIFWAMDFNNSIIGTIVFHRISLEENYAEIGYELFPKYQQKGFMSEAMKVVLQFGIEQMKLKVIEAYTHKNNIASRALLEKHGFLFQPERRCESFEFNRIFKLQIVN